MSVGRYNVIESPTPYEGVEIKHFNYIWEGVEIGEGTKIGSYCELEKGTKIGKNCMIQGRIRTGPRAVIGDDVVIKYGTIITDEAVIKRNTFIGPNVITLGAESDRAKVYGTIIGENCFIGAGSKITAGVHICDNVIIGANSFVKKDITEPGIYVGTPVKRVK